MFILICRSLIKLVEFFVLIGMMFACHSGIQKKTLNITELENMVMAGDFKKVGHFCDSIRVGCQLTSDQALKLDSIQEICRRISLDFRLSEEDVKKQLSIYFPAMDSTLFRRWVESGKLEMKLIDGQKRYFSHAVSNLFRLDDEAMTFKEKVDGHSVDSLAIFCLEHTQKVISQTKNLGEPTAVQKFRLNYTVNLKRNAVPDGALVRCWLPFPREGISRQKNIRMVKSEPEHAVIADNSNLQRSVYLEKKAKKDQPTEFNLEFDVETAAQYFDLQPEMIKPYCTESEIYRQFTQERKPQIVFSPEIRKLAERILKGETNPLLKVRKLYRWINDSVRWASALEYSTMMNIPHYVLATHHGDCGMQTLLFMTLARSQGIPVKWQSGWMLHPHQVNLHDWCEVYFEGIGWVPLDQSFGLQDSKEPKIRDFYMTGIDSYRLIVNDDFSCQLSPAKKFMRSEPYDFQRGELEWEGGNLYFDQWSWQMKVTSLP